MGEGEMTPEAIQVVLTRIVRQQVEIEARLMRLEAAMLGRVMPVPPPPPEPPAPMPPAPVSIAPPPPAPPPPAPGARHSAPFEAKLGLRWLNRIGVVTLILGVAFAFKTATDYGWIGPSARVALGVLAALVSLVAGDRMWARGHAVFASGLIGLGLAIFYLVWWASFSLYDLVPKELAFALMIATTGGSAALSLRYRAQAIALLALFGGFATPIVLSTGEPHPVIFLGYVVLLTGGALALARKQTWAFLEVFAVIGALVLYAGWLAVSARDEDHAIATVFAFLIYAEVACARTRQLWWIAQMLGSLAMVAIWGEQEPTLPCLIALSLAGLVVHQVRPGAPQSWTLTCLSLAYALVIAPHGPASPVGNFMYLSIAFAMFTASVMWHAHKRAVTGDDLVLVVASPAAYYTAAYRVLAADDSAYLGLLAVALAAVNIVLARRLWNVPRADEDQPRPGVLALGVGVTCFALAVPVQLSGFSIAIAWALQAAGLVWLSARFKESKLAIGGAIPARRRRVRARRGRRSPRRHRPAGARERALPVVRGPRGQLLRIGEVVRRSQARRRRLRGGARARAGRRRARAGRLDRARVSGQRVRDHDGRAVDLDGDLRGRAGVGRRRAPRRRRSHPRPRGPRDRDREAVRQRRVGARAPVPHRRVPRPRPAAGVGVLLWYSRFRGMARAAVEARRLRRLALGPCRRGTVSRLSTSSGVTWREETIARDGRQLVLGAPTSALVVRADRATS